MSIIKRVFLFFIFLTTHFVFAQRCGYDYLQAFVVEIVDKNHTENIPDLKLTLTNEFGEKLEYTRPQSNGYSLPDEEPHVSLPARLKLPFLKNYQPSNLMEFWENGNTKGLSHPDINQPAHLKLADNLYVIFIQFQHSINTHVALPNFQIWVEDPDSIKHFNQFPTRLFRLNPEKAVYLCANHLIGKSEGVFDRIYHLDGTRFEPQKFDLSAGNPLYTGKVERPFYFDLDFQPVNHHVHRTDMIDMKLESVNVFSGRELRFVQKIVPQHFAKYAKLQTQNQDFKELKLGVFPKNWKPEMLHEFNVKKDGKSNNWIAVLYQKGRSSSGVPHQHAFYFQHDSIANRFVFDSLLSEFPNVLFDEEPNKIIRYVITDNQYECKLTYYILEGRIWKFYKEKIIRGESVQLQISKSVLSNLYVLGYMQDKVTKFEVDEKSHFTDTIWFVNKGKSTVDLSNYTLVQTNNPRILRVEKVVIPSELKVRDTAMIIFHMEAVPNMLALSMSMPFEYLDVKIEFAFNKTEKLPLNLRYLGICKDRIEKNTSTKFNRYDDIIIAESFFFKEYQRVNYQLNTENNQIAAYGKLIYENDTLKRVGDWYFTNPRNMITYSREFEFQVTADNEKVDSTLKIFAVKKGIQTELKYRYSFDWFRLWLDPKLDSIIFQWKNYTNTISKLNNNYYQSKIMVQLIRSNIKTIYPQKYPQFVMNQSYEFQNTIYLLSMKAIIDNNYDLARHDFMMKYKGIKFQINLNYSHEFLVADFEGSSTSVINDLLSKWIRKGEIKSAHQAMNIGNGLVFLGYNLTLKPIQRIYGDSLNKIINKFGFKIDHYYGDATYLVHSDSKICNERLFQNMLSLINDPQFITANPEFLHPIKWVFDEGDREGMLNQPKKRIPKR